MLTDMRAARTAATRTRPRGGSQHKRGMNARTFASWFRVSIVVITSILRFLRIGHDAFEITACFGTVLAKRAAHKIHSHPNNFLSGVYYVRTQPGTDTINFHHLRRQTSLVD